jgi:type II secretory pathway component PulJ
VIFNVRGISLIEVLIATSLLSLLSVHIVSSQIYLLREMSAAKHRSLIIREMNNRMELLRLDVMNGGDLYTSYQQKIEGVEFVISTSASISGVGIKGSLIVVEGSWTDPHGHPQVIKLSSLIAFH